MSRLEWTVPRSLDELPRFLFLDLHQLIGAVMLLSLGMVGGSMLAGCVAAMLFAKGYARLRAGRHPLILVHLTYWHLPAWVVPLRRLPPAHQRLYLG